MDTDAPLNTTQSLSDFEFTSTEAFAIPLVATAIIYSGIPQKYAPYVSILHSLAVIAAPTWITFPLYSGHALYLLFRKTKTTPLRKSMLLLDCIGVLVGVTYRSERWIFKMARLIAPTKMIRQLWVCNLGALFISNAQTWIQNKIEQIHSRTVRSALNIMNTKTVGWACILLYTAHQSSYLTRLLPVVRTINAFI